MPQDILITPTSGEPQILFRGSGTTDTAIELNVLSSYQSATGSGTALVFEGTQGQLFAVTDNLSSGTIFSVGDITGLPLLEIDASGRLYLSRYGSTIDAFNTLQMRPSGTAAGDTSPIRFYELAANGSNYVGLKAPNSINSNLVWTLPSGDGTNNQVLKTDGAGNLGWVSAAVGAVVDGVGTSGYLARWIDGDTIGTGVVYDNGTNVGIGTTSPTAKLQVNHSSVSGLAIIGSHDRNLYIQNDGSSTGILLQHQGQNRFEVFSTGTVFINKSSTNASKSLAFYDPASNLYEYNGFGSTSGAVSALRYNVVNSNFDHIFFRGDSGAASTELMRIRGNRTVGINTAAPAAMLHVTPTGTTATGIIVRGVASQTADLFQAQNSAGTALVRVDAAGSISGVASGIFMSSLKVGSVAGDNITRAYIEENFTSQQSNGLRVRGTGSSSSIWKGRIVAGGDNVAFLMGEYNSQAWLGGHNAALNAWSPLRINPDGTTDLYLGNTGAGGSTPIITIKNSDGNVGIGTTSPTARLHVQTTGVAGTGIIVRGVASQTADLQEWQNSAGAVLAQIDAAGSISGVASGIFMQRVGVATSDPTQTLHVAGNARLTGALFDSLNLPGTSGQFLVSTSGGIEWRTGGGGGVTGTGAANKLAFFDSTTNITSDTNLHWDNTNKRLGVGQVSPATTLDILRSGVISASTTGVRIINNTTSSTTSITKEALFVASSGSFTGSTATNRALTIRSQNGNTVEGINILAQTAASTLYGIQSVVTVNSTETNVYGTHTTVDNITNSQNKTYYGYNFQLSDSETTAVTVNSYGVRTYQDFTDNTSGGSKYGFFSYIKNANNSNSPVYGLYSEINLPAAPSNNSYGCYIVGGGGGGRLSYGVYTTGTNNNYFDSRVGINQVSPTAMLQVQPTGATITGVIIRGAAAQTADLQQWQNSAGTALVRIDATGSVSGVASGIFMSRVGVNNSSPRSMLHINTTNAATSGIIVNASATQTAPLSAWQDSNNNNITTINADGTISTSGITADYYRTSANMIFTETGTVRTLTTNDNGRVIMCTNNSPVTINIGTAVGTAGFSATFIQAGSGQLTLNASGTTMNNRQSHTKTAGLWAVVSLMCRTTNNFVLAGDTGA